MTLLSRLPCGDGGAVRLGSIGIRHSRCRTVTRPYGTLGLQGKCRDAFTLAFQKVYFMCLLVTAAERQRSLSRTNALQLPTFLHRRISGLLPHSH
jgi:hypothetical protein